MALVELPIPVIHNFTRSFSPKLDFQMNGIGSECVCSDQLIGMKLWIFWLQNVIRSDVPRIFQYSFLNYSPLRKPWTGIKPVAIRNCAISWFSFNINLHMTCYCRANFAIKVVNRLDMRASAYIEHCSSISGIFAKHVSAMIMYFCCALIANAHMHTSSL